MNMTLIIGAGVVVGGGLFLLSRRASAAEPRPLSTRYTSIDRSAAGGGLTPEPVPFPPTVFATLAAPPPPPADCGPPGGPGSYYWQQNVFGDGSGSCVMVPYPDPPAPVVPSPAPKKSCPWYNPVCTVKAVGSAVVGGTKSVAKAAVDVNKKYVSYQVDQFQKGLKATAGEKIQQYQQGVTRGAA
jgi:hypothetical protein